MQINCLTQKELTYSTVISPQKTQTNKTQYVKSFFVVQNFNIALNTIR